VVTPGVSNIDALSRVLGHHAAYAKQHRELVIDSIKVHFFSPRTQPSASLAWSSSGLVDI
jgi:hypothetical protein